jgi:hypothetical protein
MSWDSYFEACSRNDIYAAFEAMAAIGVLPVVNGEDKNGKLKRPMAVKDEPWQKVTTEQWQTRLVGYLQNGVPVGIGCKPTGYVVFDIDPHEKDTTNLPTAWKESAQLLFGSDDWPKTLIVRTQGGAHAWFVVPESILKAWDRGGKKAIDLPSGGKLEIFVGLPDAGSQVACAPSEGKTIAMAQAPSVLPESAEHAILQAISQPERPKPEPGKTQGTMSTDFEWAKVVLNKGHLDSQLDDYDKWLAVGMALSHKFGEDGALLWEEWSGRHAKHVDGECMIKVRSFKRTDAEKAIRFGSLIKIATANGAPAPPKASAEFTEEFFESIEDAANAADIRAKMKERNWLWGNKEENVGWFMQGGLHLVEGKEGTGKTRYLLELERRKSLDLTWPDGSKILAEPDSKILFVASDSHWDQIAVTSEAFGIPDENVIFTGPKSDPYNFTSIDDANTIAMIRHWCQRYRVSMVVVDTLMAASTRPLVDPQEVAQMLRPLRDLAREMNVVVVLVGHLNSQGETWGRAVGRMCDNVIRMEADERDEQLITIKSVKARWNRFKLPTLRGRQGETGWEFSSPQSENGVELGTPSDRAADAILAYVRSYPDMTKSNVIEAVMEKGHSKTTAYRVFDQLVMDGRIIGYEKETFSGKTIRVFDVQRD